MHEFDYDEAKQQISEVMAIISDLRPHPHAKLVSREKFKLMAALGGDPAVIKFASRFDDYTLVWELDGEYIEQWVDLIELPCG